MVKNIILAYFIYSIIHTNMHTNLALYSYYSCKNLLLHAAFFYKEGSYKQVRIHENLDQTVSFFYVGNLKIMR